MEFFRNPKFDFLGVKVWCVGASGILMLLAILSMTTRGFAYGIDFRGGADVQLKFAEPPDVAELRGALADAGFGTLTIQTLGSSDDNEVLIRFDPKVGATRTTTLQSLKGPF